MPSYLSKSGTGHVCRYNHIKRPSRIVAFFELVEAEAIARLNIRSREYCCIFLKSEWGRDYRMYIFFVCLLRHTGSRYLDKLAALLDRVTFLQLILRAVFYRTMHLHRQQVLFACLQPNTLMTKRAVIRILFTLVMPPVYSSCSPSHSLQATFMIFILSPSVISVNTPTLHWFAFFST